MTRVRKDPEVRRTELLNTAMELFTVNGYEKTMVSDIVKKAGVAKGTFFYYFPTKESVLEQLFARFSAEQSTSFIEKSRGLSAVEKLQAFIHQMFIPDPMDDLCDKLMEELQFGLLFRIWQEQVECYFNPILTEIIRQGNQEGSMKVELIDETISFFWNNINSLWESDYLKDPPDVFANKVQIAASIIEHILGLPKSTLTLCIE